MKYFLKVLFVLVLATAVVFGVYYYTNGNPFEHNTAQLTTASQAPATEKNSNRVLIASLPKDDYYLYKGTRGVVLTHGKNEYEFTNWSRLIDEEPPEMYLVDYDGDKKKELLIKLVSEKNSTTGELAYDVYLLKEGKNDEGKTVYDVYPATKVTWGDILDRQIREEVGQLKSCKKIIQVSMNAKNKSISYDATTGVALDGFSGYACALQSDGNYLTFAGWTKGKGEYSINNKKEICIKVQVNINYKEVQTVQTAGYIFFKLSFKDGEFYVKNRSMNFTPADKYRVSDPRTADKTPWSYGETNTDPRTDYSDRVIDWIKYSTGYKSDINEQSLSYAEEFTDIRGVSRLYVTNTYVELTAKDGFSFDNGARKRGEYSVIINRGTDYEYDIAYTSKLMQINGAEVLRITFDKAYPQSEIHSIEINYGAK